MAGVMLSKTDEGISILAYINNEDLEKIGFKLPELQEGAVVDETPEFTLRVFTEVFRQLRDHDSQY